MCLLIYKEFWETSEELFDASFAIPSDITVDFTVWTDKRDRIAYEVYTTEITYVRHLQILYSVSFTCNAN